MSLASNLWVLLLQVGTGAALVVGVIYLRAYLRLRSDRINLWLGLVAIAAAGMAISEAWLYGAASAADYCLRTRWAVLLAQTTAALLVVYVSEHTGELRSPGRALAAGWAIFALLLFLQPCSVFSQIAELTFIDLPWGERLALGTGPASGLAKISLAMTVGTCLYYLVLCIRVRRKLPRREEAFLIGALALLYGLSVPHAALVDLGVVQTPYLYTPALLLLLFAFSASTGRRIARTTTLAEAVLENEARWRALFEHAELLIVRLGDSGRIESVNPYLLEVTGYAEPDLVGRRFVELVAAEDRDGLARELLAALHMSHGHARELPVRARNGEQRVVVWRSVSLHDSRGKPTGLLVVGSDVTERSRAEKARDAALAKVEDLLSQLEEENLYLKEEVRRTAGFDQIVGDSDGMVYVLHKVEQVAPLETTVLIQGETGVGKELIARAIHDHSGRRTGPFVRMNCAALAPGLAESELFGHVSGAFTGAQQARKGRFEVAHKGTLFLDEVGELPAEVQPKLLRVLQAGDYERVGSSVTSHADVRVIAATNRDLKREVEAGGFRQDLLFRLDVFPITVPPLRERREDIRLLVRHYVPRISSRLGREVEEVPARVMRKLMQYDWPGNVRELLNVLERAVITSPGTSLRLPEELRLDGQRTPAQPEEATGVGTTMAELEKRHITATLQACGWRISGEGGAAELLGLNPSTLRGRMRKHRIKRSLKRRI